MAEIDAGAIALVASANDLKSTRTTDERLLSYSTPERPLWPSWREALIGANAPALPNDEAQTPRL